MQESDNKRLRLITSTMVIFVIIPVVLYAGVVYLDDRKYYFISVVIALLACVPLFIKFERRKPQPREILTIAVMAAISVAGRMLFVVIPGFKPVAAITIITGIYLGAEAGFLTGALSAIVSNIFFGQGPWTMGTVSDVYVGNDWIPCGGTWQNRRNGEKSITDLIWCFRRCALFLWNGCVGSYFILRYFFMGGLCSGVRYRITFYDCLCSIKCNFLASARKTYW